MITACRACGLIVNADTENCGGRMLCPRCSHVIFRRRNMKYALAFSLSAVFLMLPAMLFPFLRIMINDTILSTTLFQSVAALNSEGYMPAGAAVFLTAFLVPLFYLFAVCYVSFDVVTGVRLPLSEYMAHTVHRLKHWHMVDVFLVGVLVSVVKLVDMADVALCAGFYLLAVICFFIITAGVFYDSRTFWDTRERHD